MEEILKINNENMANAMAASISAFLQSYAEMLAARQEALGESREEFLEKLAPLYNGEFAEAMEEKINDLAGELLFYGGDYEPNRTMMFVQVIDGTRKGEEYLSNIKEVLSACGIKESDFDLGLLKGVRAGTSIVDVANDRYNPRFCIKLDVMNRGTTYTSPSRDGIELEHESYTIFEDENGCLMGHIPGSKKDYPLAILMDFAVGKALDYNRKYALVDLPQKRQDALKLKQYHEGQVKFYTGIVSDYEKKSQEVPYYVKKSLEDEQKDVKHYQSNVETLDEFIEKAKDPINVRFENGTFIATLKENDGGQPGDEN